MKRTFWDQVRERKIIRGLVIYLTSSLTVLGAFNIFKGQYGFPGWTFDVLVIVLATGLPVRLIYGWIHHAAGIPVRAPEAAAYAGLALFAVGLSTLVALGAGSRRPPVEDRTLAVLPFDNLSVNAEDEYFSDGVTEDIITQLSKIADLTVISRTSVMPYKKSPKNIRDIGRELGAAAILEGSVRRDRDQVRIVAQLIDARTDRHLWSETYDRRWTDIFTIQSEVAREIARELRARLTPVERARLEKKPTGNLDAYAFYVRGRDHYYRYTAEDNDRAIEFFGRALGLDPAYALAYAGLGDAYAQKARREGWSEEWLKKAEEMSRKAVELDPELAEGYKALGLALESRGLAKEGLEAYLRAVELNPNYAPVVANLGSRSYSLGRFDEALKWLRRAVTLQPGVARFSALVALQYANLGFDALARSWAEKALAYQPDDPFPALLLAYFDLYAGQAAEAKAGVDKVLARLPGNPDALNAAGDIELLAGRFVEAGGYFKRLAEATSETGPPGNKLAFVLLKTGEARAGREILGRVLPAYLERAPRSGEGSPFWLYAAEAQALLGERDAALESFRRSAAAGYYDRWLDLDPLLEALRPDPRFKEAGAKLEASLEAMRKRVRELGLER